MKKLSSILGLLLLFSGSMYGQDHPHYTMFMYNKLLYNPGYAGSRNVTSAMAIYRSQWVGLDGAPRNYSVQVDGPVGSYMKGDKRRVSLGLSVNNEQIGITDNTTIMSYYSYKIPLEKGNVLSFGLQGGISIYSAEFSKLTPFDANDQVLNTDIRNNVLPNAGAGVYLTGTRYYLGASVPNLFENYFDKDQQNYVSGRRARQTRGYFVSGGYTIPVSDNFTLLPQAIGRYTGNGDLRLPLNADLNLSGIISNRLMLGATYRTDNSIAGIIHIQATKTINIGYSYDYSAGSELRGFNKGSHEVLLGIDFRRDQNSYVNPRFIKNF